ncbi:hypothetical protein [Promicromonospora sp. NFX87]|uniref:hypothetical protein n=1 Tax=Promicromonospora sp. NFX87 TaxID=3402691 RepID=UPI003AFB1F6A
MCTDRYTVAAGWAEQAMQLETDSATALRGIAASAHGNYVLLLAEQEHLGR